MGQKMASPRDSSIAISTMGFGKVVTRLALAAAKSFGSCLSIGISDQKPIGKRCKIPFQVNIRVKGFAIGHRIFFKNIPNLELKKLAADT